MDELFLTFPTVDRKMSPRTYSLALRELGSYRRRLLRQLAKHICGEADKSPIPFSLEKTEEGWQLTTYMPGMGHLYYFAKHRKDFKNELPYSAGRDDMLSEWVGEPTTCV